MRISFSLKVAVAIAFVSLAASTSAMSYYYLQLKDKVWSEMSRRLRDIGKTGQALFTAEQRQAMIVLSRQMQESQRGVDSKFLASIPEDEFEEAIPRERSLEIEASPEFQALAQSLRLIKAGTLEDPVYPEKLDQDLNRPEGSPTLKYTYLLAPIDEDPDYNIVRFLGDADYEEIDMNENGEIDDDEVGVPAGLLYNISAQPRMKEAFKTGKVTNTDDAFADAWGVWYSAMVPIKDREGNVIAVLGLDMDVDSDLNLLNWFFWVAVTSLVVIFFVTGAAAYFLARFLTAPIESLRRGAEQVQDRDFNTRVEVKSGDELGLLADAFNDMVREIRIHSEQLEDMVADRTARLEETLAQVQRLKLQQDGDYYLSTLLTNPLFKNRNNSDRISTDFLLRQKKQFSFRRWKAELGGDLCVSGNIKFNGSRWVMFFNGDAMGKSMQGAGGALVMGSLINSIMVRSSANDRDLQIDPREWMRQTHAEIQRIFETFDGSMYVSGALGIIEESSGRMFYLNAEHPHTVLFRKGNASFLEEEMSTRKFGMPDVEEPQIFEYQLEDGDVLIAGSDGRDDLEISSNTEGRQINQDEGLFLKICESTGGQLEGIVDALQAYGGITDDLSLIRVEFSAVPMARPVVSDIKELLQSKKFQEALSLLEQKSEPDSTIDLYHKGLCLWKLNRSEEALDYLTQAQEDLEHHTAMLRLLARVYMDLGDFMQARIHAEGALKLDPEDERAERILARIGTA
ncbi:MAG: SpoIIE family protein phosphatase [Leptospiraceae bacterium]